MKHLVAGQVSQVIQMSCHHGLQHSIRFRTQWLQAQARLVSSVSRGKPGQQRKTPKLFKPVTPSPSAIQHKAVIVEPAAAPQQLLSEGKGNAGLYEFPEKLLIYQPSAGKTALVAFIKMAGLISFCVGTVYYGIQAVADEAHSNWQVMNIAAMAGVPLSIITIATRPYVAGVHLHLPITARASLGHLKRFVTNMPSNTTVTFTTIRFLPWRALNTATTYGELFRLPSRTGRIANVQWRAKDWKSYNIASGARQRQDNSRFAFARKLRKLWLDEIDQGPPKSMVDSLVGRNVRQPHMKFFVPESEVAMKRSRAPGVWQAIWDRLPSAPE